MTRPSAISDHSPDPRTRVFALRGEFDLTSAPEFQRRVTDSIRNGTERVVVDLSDVTFFDSSMLGVLLAANRLFTGQSRGALAVICSDPALFRIFDITGLRELLGVVDTRAEALKLADERDASAGAQSPGDD